MKTRILNIAALAVALAFAAGTANAAPVEGTITMSGDFAPTGGADLSDATGIDFIGDDFIVDDANGDFAAFGVTMGDVGFYQDFMFNPLTPSPVSPLWSIAGFDFSLTSVVVSFQNADFLVLEGTGIIDGNGFDVTEGTWIFTGQSVPGPNPMSEFSFSAGSTVTGIGEPAALALVGLGLLGFGLARRRSR